MSSADTKQKHIAINMQTFLTTLVITTVIFIQSAKGAADQEANVNLRIEGIEETIFEGIISTKGYAITTTSGGTHICDGTNNNANPTPGPTAMSALNSASKLAGFTWDGTFNEQFDDYLLTRIGNSSQTTSKYWGILIDYHFTQGGGCQQRVKPGDNILFAFDAFNKTHFLKLEGSHTKTTVGSPITVTVTDGSTGIPISGAIVGDQTTDDYGRAMIMIKSLGVQKLKAERSDSIRSNAIEITALLH